MTAWAGSWGNPETGFTQVQAIEMKVERALDQGLLSQILDHTGRCTDQSPMPVGMRFTDADGFARCPRRFLLQARDDKFGSLRASTLKLRVIVQIKQYSVLDGIVWD